MSLKAFNPDGIVSLSAEQVSYVLQLFAAAHEIETYPSLLKSPMPKLALADYMLVLQSFESALSQAPDYERSLLLEPRDYTSMDASPPPGLISAAQKLVSASQVLQKSLGSREAFPDSPTDTKTLHAAVMEARAFAGCIAQSAELFPEKPASINYTERVTRTPTTPGSGRRAG